MHFLNENDTRIIESVFKSASSKFQLILVVHRYISERYAPLAYIPMLNRTEEYYFNIFMKLITICSINKTYIIY